MNLETAEKIASQVVEKLKPFCDRIEVAGSIRRRKGWVNDIDVVCIPSNPGHFLAALAEFGKVKAGGEKIIRLNSKPKIGMDVDVYVADPKTWSTLMLIRTGSKEHNIALCSKAKSRGMILKADGSGLFRIVNNEFVRIAGDTEESIFKALDIPFKAPEKREV